MLENAYTKGTRSTLNFYFHVAIASFHRILSCNYGMTIEADYVIAIQMHCFMTSSWVSFSKQVLLAYKSVCAFYRGISPSLEELLSAGNSNSCMKPLYRASFSFN